MKDKHLLIPIILGTLLALGISTYNQNAKISELQGQINAMREPEVVSNDGQLKVVRYYQNGKPCYIEYNLGNKMNEYCL